MSRIQGMCILRNASVEIKPEINSHQQIILTIIIDNLFEHCFPSTSKESRMLLNNDRKIVEDYFNNGTYVVCNNVLVDYRPSTYSGFIQTDYSLSKLEEVIGAEDLSKKPTKTPVNGLFNQSRSSKSNGFFLGGEWDKFDLDINALGIGGEFSNQLIYKYSPFSENVKTSFEVTRLICSNGMVATSPFVTFDVPIISDWESNLNVVSAQLKPKLNDILDYRFSQMAQQRASVDCVLKTDKIINERFVNLKNPTVEELNKIENLHKISDVTSILSSYYENDVFEDSNIANQHDSHLTQFDCFNILTELSTHAGREEKTDIDAQRLLNKIVFDDFKNKKKIIPSIPKSQDSDFKRAFFS